ncbi:MAG TPA: hypothetical protein VN648_26620 [Candidatus Methylomirabilis sp.]|nr:hypothetical protein [Candidatus Methylomirabilis sp.]
MTAFKYLALSSLICGLLAPSALAAPVFSTSGDWWWWSPVYASAATSNWAPQQFANSFYGPSATSSTPTAPVTAATMLAPTPPPASAPVANANLNLGLGPYPLESSITTGSAQPWYNSSQIANFFGGQPTPQQISSFDNVVMQRVEQTFQQSGVPITLTLNSSDPAAHTLSLVSNTTSNSNPWVIGMTQIGGQGFSFMDQEAKSAQSLDQLQWIVAHNICHELMLAFGVSENYDQTGNYIDARNANWAMMVDPNATFSQAAAQALQAALSSNSPVTTGVQGAQVIGGQPVPEPTTVACWLAGLSAAALMRRKLIGTR